jgi:sialate O-acetylesterase
MLKLPIWIAGILIVMAANGYAATAPLLSPIFGDNMVLQRGKPNRIWGWAKPGDVVRVQIAGSSQRATAGADGRWQVSIDPPPPPGPYELNVTGPRNITLHNVLVGDVWLCGGQSNMALGLGMVRNGAQEIKAATHPNVRFFIVPQHVSYSPTLAPKGDWKVCTPKTVASVGAGGFSAVAYFYGVKLSEQLHVPIGLIEDCVGGTPVETWMNPDKLRGFKQFAPAIAEIERLRSLGGPEYGNYIMHWFDQYDLGLQGKTWAATDFDDSGWKTVTLPDGFAELGVPATPCVCWFRKTIELPDPLPAGDGAIFLGEVEKMDTTYVNGQWVGASSWVENPRIYPVHRAILRPGRNVIAIRVFKMRPKGGFLDGARALRLVLGDHASIPLAGEWKGAVSVDARPPHPLPLGFENYPIMPSVLYDGMIAPIAPLALTGAIWYQGEANTDRPYEYRSLLPAMIGDWRAAFGQRDFPFYIVSLPAFMHRKPEPTDDGWAELREAQALTARDVPNCGLAVTIDTGDPDNIHPKDKRIVSERLALCALAGHYGLKIPFAGPTFASAETLPGALRLHFDNADGGLTAKGGEAKEFSIAGADRKWHWATAKIDGDSILVSSPDVLNPVAARYAWQANPAATVYNGAGLPAVPFRTDDWGH